jgi:hypothetical protein
MKIDIEDNGETISVKVVVRPIHRKNYNVKVKFSTKDLLNHLEKENIKVGACLKDAVVVTNKTRPEHRSGEWIFEKPKKPVRSRKKVKKVEKILDKSPEHVIIEVEKKETPTLSETQPVTEE